MTNKYVFLKLIPQKKRNKFIKYLSNKDGTKNRSTLDNFKYTKFDINQK